MNVSYALRAPHLHALTRNLFVAADTPRPIADKVAAILVNSNLAGHDSHGVLRVPAYLQLIADGRLHPSAEPQVLKETPTTLLIDGQNGFGHYTAQRGMALAIDKAKQANVCCVSFVHIGHIGRVGEYAEQAARAGCIGLITVGFGSRNPVGRTTPYGGLFGVLGTNPIAVGVPTGDAIPFVLDYATSVVAEGKIQVARSKNLDVPPSTIVDKQGQPTVKTAEFYEGGALLPFGKHKGYALSLLTCLLAGLSGEFEAERAVLAGVFMLVLNIEAFTPLADYQQNVRTFLDGIKATPPADGVEEVLAPGDFEQRNRAQRLAQGIELPTMIYQQMQTWAERLNVATGEEIVEAADAQRYQA
jgi:uncharacterized oxidoreductase